MGQSEQQNGENPANEEDTQNCDEFQTLLATFPGSEVVVVPKNPDEKPEKVSVIRWTFESPNTEKKTLSYVKSNSDLKWEHMIIGKFS